MTNRIKLNTPLSLQPPSNNNTIDNRPITNQLLGSYAQPINTQPIESTNLQLSPIDNPLSTVIKDDSYIQRQEATTNTITSPNNQHNNATSTVDIEKYMKRNANSPEMQKSITHSSILDHVAIIDPQVQP
jgi:hypothetical protein